MDDLDLGATIRGFSAGQKLFQRYTLRRILGRGGMGVVWLAADEKLEREVALKFLPEIVQSDRASMEELKRETRRALELTHSNIVRIYDFVEDSAVAAIAMEYVPGDTLANRRLEQPGQAFAPGTIARWVRQLCDAIAYAHEKARVVHRDLKPANLMLDAHEDLKVADFGIARSISDSVSRISAQAGSSGTPAYMSPQQMMGERPTPADDVYAIGATLYELLTGKPPFYSGNLIAQVQAKVPPPLTQRRLELGSGAEPIPARWEEVIAACLAKDPVDRPASAREIAQRLELRPGGATHAPFVPRPVAVAGPAAAPAAPREPPARPTRRLGAWLVGTAAALLAMGAAGWYFGVARPREQERQQEQQKQLAAQALAAAEQQAREREGEDWRSRLAAGTVLPAAIETVAKENTPRGQAARDHLAARLREQANTEQAQWREIAAYVERVSPVAARSEFEDVEARVRAYLATAPTRYRGEVEAAWNRRRAAWLEHEAANRPGTLAVETNPPGATVILYPRNERRTSPAVFREVKPGEVTFRVEKEGYEPVDVPFEVKPGAENRPATVPLTALFGSIAASSDPPAIRVVVEGAGRRVEGVTPLAVPSLAPGNYRVTFERAGWQPQVRSVAVERAREAVAHADLRGAALELQTTPAGATLMLDGREIGRAPLRLTDLEKRTYRLEATAAGHEPASRVLELARDETVQFTLVERPASRMLRTLAGHTWRLDSPWGWAELKFDLEGGITGSHKIPLAAVMQDTGSVIKVAPTARALTASFVPSKPHPFYTGEVDMTLVDDYTLEVQWTWMIGGKRQIFNYRRTDAPAQTSPKRTR